MSKCRSMNIKPLRLKGKVNKRSWTYLIWMKFRARKIMVFDDFLTIIIIFMFHCMFYQFERWKVHRSPFPYSELWKLIINWCSAFKFAKKREENHFFSSLYSFFNRVELLLYIGSQECDIPILEVAHRVRLHHMERWPEKPYLASCYIFTSVINENANRNARVHRHYLFSSYFISFFWAAIHSLPFSRITTAYLCSVWTPLMCDGVF